MTHQIGGTESLAEDICIATCATSNADWSAWGHSKEHLFLCSSRLCDATAQTSSMILIVWGLGPGVKTKRIREICTGYSIGWNVAYTSHTDIYPGAYILNLSLLANSIDYTHLAWTWKPSTMTITITSRAGQAGGGSFQEKNYKSKKVFAYRMCTGWPTTAMPKPSCLSERAFSRSMVVMWWPVLMWLVAGSDEVMRLVVRWREVR